MKAKATHLTKEQVRVMSPDDYTSLRDAYYKAAEGIASLYDHIDLLGSKDKEALKDLRAAMAKLNALGSVL